MRQVDNPPAHESVIFAPGDEAAMKYLDEEGWVAIGPVMDAEEVKKATSLFWDHVEQIDGLNIRRNDPRSWDTWIASPHTGIVASYAIGQSDFLWALRLNKHVISTFASIWRTPDLLTSFDGCGVFRPVEYSSAWRTKGAWPHVDQNGRTKPGRCSVQGAVLLTNSGAKDGGLVVVPKSHLLYPPPLLHLHPNSLCAH
jgi:hypothetical protein